MQTLIRAVEDMFASPAFLASQIRSRPAPSPSESTPQPASAPMLDMQRIAELYTASCSAEGISCMREGMLFTGRGAGGEDSLEG